MKTPTTLFQILSRNLKGSTYTIVTKSQEIQFMSRIGAAVCPCSLRAIDDTRLDLEIHSPITVNNPRFKSLVVDLIRLINKQCHSGSFNIDASNGTFSYTSSVHIDDVDFCVAFFAELQRQSRRNFEIYFPAFMSVMFGGCTPEDAIFLAELSDCSYPLDIAC